MKWNKKLAILGAFVLLLWLFPTKGHAQSVDDQASLFTEEQITLLNQLAANLDEKIKGRVYIVTTTSNDDSEETYADNYLRKKVGNNQNGSVFLIDMGQRGYHVSTSGNMIDYLTDSRLEKMLDSIQENLSAGSYFEAAKSYLEESSAYVSDGVPGGHYRVDRDTGKITYYKVLTPFEIIIALTVASIISLITFFWIKSTYQLKRKTYHYPFREKATVTLADQSDRLTKSFVTTRRIPKPSNNNNGGGFGGGSTTHSSGGGTFGGGGGKF